jgi:glucokinase
MTGKKFFLAADIGATKAHLALFPCFSTRKEPAGEEILPSAAYSSCEDLLEDFLGRMKVKPEGAVLAVAGPVMGEKAKLTNLPWEITSASLKARFGLKKVILVNDILALAAGIPLLGTEDQVTLQEGRTDPEGVCAIIAPGTGLGEAFFVKEARGYRTFPSEGGHADFAPGNPLEAELYLKLAAEFGHVSWDHLVSGRGISRIYRFLAERSGPGGETLSCLEAGQDATPAIIAAALHKSPPCPRSRETLEIFSRILAAEAGNMALRFWAGGGVYLGGGIPRRILPCLQEKSFLAAFRNKGRLSWVLANIPLKVIIHPGASLLGAAALGWEMVKAAPRRRPG